MQDTKISWAQGTVSSWIGCHLADADSEGLLYQCHHPMQREPPVLEERPSRFHPGAG
jgi:hypothetical protein